MQITICSTVSEVKIKALITKGSQENSLVSCIINYTKPRRLILLCSYSLWLFAEQLPAEERVIYCSLAVGDTCLPGEWGYGAEQVGRANKDFGSLQRTLLGSGCKDKDG